MKDFSSPPTKKPRQADNSFDDDFESDDSFDQPVSKEVSKVAQRIMTQRIASQQNQRSNTSVTVNTSRSDEAPSRQSHTQLTPRRYTAQKQNEFQQSGQYLMMKNSIENLKRNKERSEREYAEKLRAVEMQRLADLREKDDEIKRLHDEIQLVKNDTVSRSFFMQNALLEQNGDFANLDANVNVATSAVTVTAGNSSGMALHLKKVIINRENVRWPSVNGFRSDRHVKHHSIFKHPPNSNSEDTFAQIPSQSVFHHHHQEVEKPPTTTRECQVDMENENEKWNVKKYMREHFLEAVMNLAIDIPDAVFDLQKLEDLCVIDGKPLKECLLPKQMF